MDTQLFYNQYNAKTLIINFKNLKKQLTGRVIFINGKPNLYAYGTGFIEITDADKVVGIC